MCLATSNWRPFCDQNWNEAAAFYSSIAIPVLTDPMSSYRTNGGRMKKPWSAGARTPSIVRSSEQGASSISRTIGCGSGLPSTLRALLQRLAHFGFSIMMLCRRGRPAASCSRAFTRKGNFLSCPSRRLPCRTCRQIARPSRSLATTRWMSALKLRRSIRRSCAIARDCCIGIHDSLVGGIARISTRPDARSEIPHSRLHVMVHIDNKVLPR
jgi:hypothetical protein